MIEKPWDWKNINNDYWRIPDEYMYSLVDRWNGLKKDKVLDLGCGIGRHSILFAKNNFDTTAVDISQDALDEIKSYSNKNSLNINTVLSNITDLKLEDNKFDCIIAFNSIYHTNIEGFKKVISELKRVLRKDGEAFITLLSKEDPSYELSSNKIVDYNTRMKKEEDGSELPHLFIEYKEIDKLFEGFEIISIKQITEFFNSKKHIHFNILLKLEEKDESKNT